MTNEDPKLTHLNKRLALIPEELKIGQVYFSKIQNRIVKYIGINKYNGKFYYNFYEPVMRLFHWLDLSDVRPLNSNELYKHVYVEAKLRGEKYPDRIAADAVEAALGLKDTTRE
jgi:hypothetical protein